MGFLKDHYFATYNGHTIELINNEWTKTVRLLIDGKIAASRMRLFPRTIVFERTLESDGAQRSVVARFEEHFMSADVVLEIDGKEIVFEKIY